MADTPDPQPPSVSLSARLAVVLAEEVFIRSQGWSEWPTLEEIRKDTPGIIAALGEAAGWGGFDAWHAGTQASVLALLDSIDGGKP